MAVQKITVIIRMMSSSGEKIVSRSGTEGAAVATAKREMSSNPNGTVCMSRTRAPTMQKFQVISGEMRSPKELKDGATQHQRKIVRFLEKMRFRDRANIKRSRSAKTTEMLKYEPSKCS